MAGPLGWSRRLLDLCGRYLALSDGAARAVNLSLKFLGESIEPVYGIANIAIIVTPIAVTLVGVPIPLCGCHSGQT